MEYDFKVILESAGLTTYVIWMICYFDQVQELSSCDVFSVLPSGSSALASSVFSRHSVVLGLSLWKQADISVVKI